MRDVVNQSVVDGRAEEQKDGTWKLLSDVGGKKVEATASNADAAHRLLKAGGKVVELRYASGQVHVIEG